MTANPLMDPNRLPVTRDLDSYCSWLNGMEFVRQSGAPYHVAERDAPNGQRERYLGRGA